MSGSARMFEYFPNYYPWNMSVLMAIQVGGEISEIDEACRPLLECVSRPAKERQLKWRESWCALADRVRGMAERDLDDGNARAASRKFKRACIYYMAAERQMSRHDHLKMKTYDSMLESFRLSMETGKNPVEFVDIPFEKWQLPSLYLAPPASSKPGPCMIVFDGFDVTKEWSFLSDLTTELGARGVGCLHVDHPGIGASIRKLGLSAMHDIERVTSACVDWLEKRIEVDPRRVGIIAPSLGGYYAFRSAAFEPRLACAVAHGARWDNDGSHGRILRSPESARSIADWLDHAMWYYGTETTEATANAIAAMTLEGGVAERIRCPVLVAHGVNDRQVPIEQAHKMIERTINSPRRDLRIFDYSEGGVEHCGIDNFSIQTDFMTGWIAEILNSK